MTECFVFCAFQAIETLLAPRRGEHQVEAARSRVQAVGAKKALHSTTPFWQDRAIIVASQSALEARAQALARPIAFFFLFFFCVCVFWVIFVAQR